MHVDRHPLTKELPEYKDKIHELKMSNAHFAHLFDKYHDIDHEIVRLEDGVDNINDEDLEVLKKQRLKLKDQLFGMLREA